MDEVNKTRHTLLRRASQGDDEGAWHELVQHYCRFIYHILNELGVAPDDIEDLSQQILVSLNRDLSSYDRTRAKFRSWFGAVIRNVALDHFRKKNALQKNMKLFTIEDSLSRDAHVPELTRMIEDEWSTYIANLALEKIRPLFRGQALRVFQLDLDGHDTREIARQTGLAVASVYTLRKRVKKRLYLEIRAISSDLEG